MENDLINKYFEFTEKTIFKTSIEHRLFMERLEDLKKEGIDISRLLTAGIGLSNESGEFLGIIKKILFHNKPYNKEELMDELSDILWYLPHALKALDITLDELIEYNIDKLTKRHGIEK